MIPLMELLMQGGNGAAMDAIARQMGISRVEAERAAEALMPAFSQGFKRNVADPAGFMQFMANLAGGGYANYFDNPAQAASLGGIQQGDAILGNLFGSKEMSRAIAAQAAQATGLSQAMLKQMMPMLAPILMGGLFKQMAQGSTANSTSGGAANPLGRILEQMMGGGGGYSRGDPAGGFGGGSGNPWGQIFEDMMRGAQGSPNGGGSASQGDNPFGKMLQDMLGGGSRGGSQSDRAQGDRAQQPDNPLGNIFNEMLRAGRGEPEPEPQQRPRQQAQEPREPEKTYRPSQDGEPQPETKGGLEDLFGKMFETGRATQQDYQRGVEQIFDQFWGKGKSGS